ncbi:MAG: UDP-N-acetylmuramoyl-L-alanyl-D-glutamate--2,6-diaminopimelate ligase [Candidatus Omnitrophota bacterium]
MEAPRQCCCSRQEKRSRGGVTFIYAKDARSCLSQVCKAYYGDVSAQIRLLGITGTNGKTTITYLIESLFKSNNKPIGVIGTINYRFGERLIPATNTTPGILDLHIILKAMLKQRITNCAMEVSSHSLEQGRVDSLLFDAAIFTNLTKEHMDYHKDMDSYLNAKLRLFTKIKEGGFAIVNADDPASMRIMEKVRENKGINLMTYGIERRSDVMAGDIKFSFSGVRFSAAFRGDSVEIESSLIGRHNVYNLLAGFCAGLASGMKPPEIKSGLEALKSLPGRLERIDTDRGFSVYVDYAHTEDGMEKVLGALRELRPIRLISVFGCGGDRDRTKRSGMGRISTALSDKVFITSDNPRGEDPMAIIDEIKSGIGPDADNYEIEPDRFSAIRMALEYAREGDIVLVAGKGHETYQIFKNYTLPFDDREAVKKVLKERKPCLQSGRS